jgi:hypothetical protein
MSGIGYAGTNGILLNATKFVRDLYESASLERMGRNEGSDDTNKPQRVLKGWLSSSNG